MRCDNGRKVGKAETKTEREVEERFKYAVLLILKMEEEVMS